MDYRETVDQYSMRLWIMVLCYLLGDSDRKSVGRQLQEECWERVTGRVLETVTGRVLGDSDRKSVRRR